MKSQNEREADTLEQIKRLLILGLVQQGVQGKDIANVLQVDPAVISRIISVRRSKGEKNSE